MQPWKILVLFALTGSCWPVAGEVLKNTNTVVVSPTLISVWSEEMRTNHPALQAARARTNAAAAGVSAVRTWEDPMLRLGGMAADTEMRSAEGDILYGIEQKLPLFGRPALARRSARTELDVEAANAEAQFQVLRSELAQTAFRAALAGETIAVSEQDLAWLRTMTDAAQARYASGGATLVEVLQLQNEQAKRQTQLQTERDAFAQTRVRLNRLLNRPMNSAWPLLQLPAVAQPVVFSEQLISFATRYEPRLRALRQQVKAAAATVEATRRSRLPEVSVGLENRNYSGNGEWRQTELMLNFSLPVFNKKKYRADLQRDEAKLKTVESEAGDYELSLREEVHGLTVKIDAARREALLYRDEILPRTASGLESARAGWEAGRGSFRDVLDARRMLLEGRLMYARAVSEQYQMLSELVLCCGLGDLEALQMLGVAPETQKGETEP
jgi:outer membrane protein TolC